MASIVFPDFPLPVSFDRLMLTEGRRESLLQEIKLSSEPFAVAKARMQAALAHLAASTSDDSENLSFEDSEFDCDCDCDDS